MQNEDKDREKRESVIKQEVGVRAIRREGKTKREREKGRKGKGQGKGKEGVEWAVAEIIMAKNGGEEEGDGVGWDGMGRIDTTPFNEYELEQE